MKDGIYIIGDDMRIAKLFDIRKITRLFIAAAGIYMSIRYSAECSRGIQNGILFCIEALVPSLFVFMAVSAYIVKSGVADYIPKPLGWFVKKWFGLPENAAAVILLSATGGYPIGAGCAAMMYGDGRLDREQAEKTVYTAVCAGPGFLINFVGRALLGSAEAGAVLLAAELIGLLLTGFIIGRVLPCQTDNHAQKAHNNRSGTLTAAVADASRSTFHMCSMVVICSAVTEIISSVSPDEALTDIASAILEITAGCNTMCGKYPLSLIAFFIGFGGISVHLQIFAALGKLSIRKTLFFLFRIIQGIITAGAAYVLLIMRPIELSVFNSTDVPLTAARYATLAGSAALAMCSLCFAGAVHKNSFRR